MGTPYRTWKSLLQLDKIIDIRETIWHINRDDLRTVFPDNRTLNPATANDGF